LGLNSWINPPSPKFFKLRNSCREKNEKNSENSRENVNNRKLAKKLASQI
jgi:hypothetical protein